MTNRQPKKIVPSSDTQSRPKSIKQATNYGWNEQLKGKVAKLKVIDSIVVVLCDMKK